MGLFVSSREDGRGLIDCAPLTNRCAKVLRVGKGGPAGRDRSIMVLSSLVRDKRATRAPAGAQGKSQNAAEDLTVRRGGDMSVSPRLFRTPAGS